MPREVRVLVPSRAPLCECKQLPVRDARLLAIGWWFNDAVEATVSTASGGADSISQDGKGD